MTLCSIALARSCAASGVRGDQLRAFRRGRKLRALQRDDVGLDELLPFLDQAGQGGARLFIHLVEGGEHRIGLAPDGLREAVQGRRVRRQRDLRERGLQRGAGGAHAAERAKRVGDLLDSVGRGKTLVGRRVAAVEGRDEPDQRIALFGGERLQGRRETFGDLRGDMLKFAELGLSLDRFADERVDLLQVRADLAERLRDGLALRGLHAALAQAREQRFRALHFVVEDLGLLGARLARRGAGEAAAGRHDAVALADEVEGGFDARQLFIDDDAERAVELAEGEP